MRNMRPSFSTAIVAAVLSLAETCLAQLPQECFLHSEVHGADLSRKFGRYQSDLPSLETDFDPVMEVDAITAYL